MEKNRSKDFIEAMKNNKEISNLINELARENQNISQRSNKIPIMIGPKGFAKMKP